MNINEQKLFLELLAQKSQSGGFTIDQFNLAAQRAQIQLFERDFKVWQETQEVTEALAVFLTLNAPFSIPNTGLLVLPSDFYHPASVSTYGSTTNTTTGTRIPCWEVKAADLSMILTTTLSPPNARWPKYVWTGLSLQFYPKTLGTAIIDYFRQPTNPVWAYTMVNSRPVYDATNSVQIELPDFAQNEFVGIMCEYLGINIRDGSLAQFSQQFKAENSQV